MSDMWWMCLLRVVHVMCGAHLRRLESTNLHKVDNDAVSYLPMSGLLTRVRRRWTGIKVQLIKSGLPRSLSLIRRVGRVTPCL